MIDDLLYGWENSSGMKRKEFERKIEKIYVPSPPRSRMRIRSQVGDYYRHSEEKPDFLIRLRELDTRIEEKERLLP